MKITWFTDGDEVINISCEGYKAKDGQDGDGIIVGYQSSASEPSVLPTPKTLAEYDKAQDDIGHVLHSLTDQASLYGLLE